MAPDLDHRRPAKLIFYSAFVEGKLDAPKSPLSEVHRLYFEPEYPEFASRTMWSLSNAITSALKELDPIPQFKATAKLGEFLGGSSRSLYDQWANGGLGGYVTRAFLAINATAIGTSRIIQLSDVDNASLIGCCGSGAAKVRRCWWITSSRDSEGLMFWRTQSEGLLEDTPSRIRCVLRSARAQPKRARNYRQS